jgi:Raf kinase inhibitor-like YbhB/YbcL family protein
MAEQGFTLSSPAFHNGARIPAELTCDGKNLSVPLDWMHPPNGTASFALIVDDPDAPRGTFTHWVLFDIPADTSSLQKGQADAGVPGRNDFQQAGYGGPCPPANHGEHRYFFHLSALDVVSLNLDAGCSRKDVEAAMKGHVLDVAELMGRYERRPGA